MLYVQVQRKVQAELDSVVGAGATVSWEHRTNLPYTVAVLKEIQR